jgi:hypothetical protein
MSNLKGFKIVNLFNKALSRIQPNKAAAEPEEEIVLEKGNPWRQSLNRLANEHKFNFDHISQSEELSNVVADLTKEAEAQKNTQAEPPKGAKPRVGDRTINDMKSWWKDSLSTADDEHRFSELPGKTRLLKRWFE